MPIAAFSQIASTLIVCLIIGAWAGGLVLLALKGHWLLIVFSFIPFPPIALLGYILKKKEDRPGLKELLYNRERYWHESKQNLRNDLKRVFLPQKKSG